MCVDMYIHSHTLIHVQACLLPYAYLYMYTLKCSESDPLTEVIIVVDSLGERIQRCLVLCSILVTSNMLCRRSHHPH